MGGGTKIFITGLPGCGKTTLLKKLAGELHRLQPVGFYTEEIRAGGVRQGFALRSLDGKEGVLARVGLSATHRIGRYGVDVAAFESFLEAIPFDQSGAGLIMIDEIGKMECLSGKFQEMVSAFLDSDRRLVATIAQHGGGLIEKIKSRKDVRIYTLTAQNRGRLSETISSEILRSPPDC
jgi:nucleoside-triphosphatase